MTLEDILKNEEMRGILIEMLAETSHEIWAHWMEYMFSKCDVLESGVLIIPKDLEKRWRRQIETKYGKLSNKEQESDREQAHKLERTLSIFLEDLKTNKNTNL